MYHYTSMDEDFFAETNSSSPGFWTNEETTGYHVKPKKPLREKNSERRNGMYKHVTHKDKPPQVVAKRNARERRRVQAVNSAFIRLKNALPIQNARGKRISKVKTLLCAMEYIRSLDKILQDSANYTNFYEMIEYPQITQAEFEFCNHWTNEKDINNANLLKYLN